MKILIATADRIGDTLMCTPAIHLLKKSSPHIQLDVLTYTKAAAAIFAHNPDIGQVHVASSNSAIRRLAQNYSKIICLNPMHRLTRHLHHLPTELITIKPFTADQHQTQQIITFIQSMLEDLNQEIDHQYRLYPQPADKSSIKNLLTQQGVNLEQNLLIGCQLGCHRTARRGWKFWNLKRHQHKKVWPLENYIELANRLINSSANIRLILTGSKSERYLARKFLAKVPSAIDLIGKTSIPETTALMDLLKVYLTHDTGTMHLACVRNTPLVTLFRTDRISHTGPYPMRPQYTIIHNQTMADITVDEVYQALIQKTKQP